MYNQPVAATDTPVLISGETGTGKDLIARTLQLASPRKGDPFVTVYCASTTPEEIQQALLGDNALSRDYTSQTDSAAEGGLAHARCGTTFLNEVGELPFGSAAGRDRIHGLTIGRR